MTLTILSYLLQGAPPSWTGWQGIIVGALGAIILVGGAAIILASKRREEVQATASAAAKEWEANYKAMKESRDNARADCRERDETITRLKRDIEELNRRHADEVETLQVAYESLGGVTLKELIDVNKIHLDNKRLAAELARIGDGGGAPRQLGA